MQEEKWYDHVIVGSVWAGILFWLFDLEGWSIPITIMIGVALTRLSSTRKSNQQQ